MKEFSAKEKLILSVCLVLTVLSVFVLIGQIRLSAYADAVISAKAATEAQISWFEETSVEASESAAQTERETDSDNESAAKTDSVQGGEKYVINTSSKKIHSPDCQYAQSMKEENRSEVYIDDLSEYIDKGYSICSKCNAGQ